MVFDFETNVMLWAVDCLGILIVAINPRPGINLNALFSTLVGAEEAILHLIP